MIFLAITGSWTAALVYDRREKKRMQKKWAKLVSHIAQEPLDTQTMPRKVTIYLSAPPADSLMSTRDHFHEYVKPILVAAALDWDAVEGRREGDVRAGLAERIRKLRKTGGEESAEPLEEDLDVVLAQTRQKSGVKAWDGPAGDIIIGRNTWKEYIRGLHEGWLGPLDPPRSPTDAAQEATSSNILETTPEQPTSTEFSTDTASTPVDDASPTAPVTPPATPESEKSAEEESKKPAKKKQLPPFNTTASYGISVISPNCPLELPPSTTIAFPHLLGFLNTPIRMYRFLNRRHLADDIGRQTAAAVLAVYQPYGSPGESHFNPESNSLPSGEESNDSASQWEQQRQLQHEEAEWHKSVRERKDDDGGERVWLDDIVLDPRIAERMRKFELDSEHEERARKIAAEIGDPWWRGVWAKGKQEKRGSNQWGDEVE
jgi:import inner membrane translocase subunit TIM54